MNIAAEKASIIQRFELVQDVDLIKAIKHLLDFGFSGQATQEPPINEFADMDDWDEIENEAQESIARGLKQIKEGKTIPLEVVLKK